MPKRRAINDDFVRLNARCAGDARLGRLPRFEVVMEPADDILPALLADLGRQHVTGPYNCRHSKRFSRCATVEFRV